MKRQLKVFVLTVLAAGMSGSVWALDQVNGVYQIGTAQDLADFANYVNAERRTGINAELTANIDFTSNSEMIGIEGKPYNGTFDGKGFTVTVAYNTSANETALFRRANGATIKNLKVTGTITTTGQFAAGIVSGIWQTTTIENCVTSVAISDNGSGDGTHGGIVARISDKGGADAIIIRNCAFLGSLNAPNRTGSGGILGWPDNAGEKQVIIENCLMGGTLNLATGSDNDIIVRNSASVTNCYYLNQQSINNSKNATLATAEQLASGELCFLLNGSQSETPAWFQTIGTDEMPSPLGTDTVYAIGALNCNGTPKGEVSYSNTYSEAVRDAHDFNEWGFCTVCDAMQPDFLTVEDGYYLIGTKQQYNWFMVYANSENSAANAKLTQDLDLSDYNFTSIGNDSHRYHGTFDGQGHRVKNMSIVGTTKELGFFSVCSNATIKNLILDASCNINSGNCTAALVGCCNGSGDLVIENVGVECNVTGTGANAAAFVGCNYGGIAIKIKNCYNTGNITAEKESAVFSGWFGNNGNAKVENCWSAGKVTGQDGQNSFGRGIGAQQFVNAYDLNSENNPIDATKLTDYDSSWLASGKLAYIMNGNKSTDVVWYQTIGTDAHPMLFGTTDIVYANGTILCDHITPAEGSEIVFSNTDQSIISDHQFEEGFCKICKVYDPQYMTAVSGYYQVSTPIQLLWTAAVSQDNSAIKVKLMNNIDMDGVAFDGFGSNLSDDSRFTGEIDGQRHIISNLKMNADRQGVGLVNTATVGAKIKNLTMASTCEFKGSSAVAAFIGAVRGSEGELYIENCGNEGAVTASGANGAGFVGCKYDDNVIPCLTNCYNVGEIRSGYDGGSFSGWMPKAKMVNCYSIAGYPSAEDTYGFQEGNQFSRGWSIELTNCYDFGTGDWGQNNGSWGDNCFVGDRKITEVNETTMGVVFAGLYDAEGGNVWRMEYEGWAHPVLYDPATTVLSENVPARFEAASNVNLTLKRTTVADTWNTFCAPFALTAAQITDVFGTDAKVAELTGAEGETMNFTTVDAIEAGKAYLVKPTAAIAEKEVTVDLVAGTPVATTQAGYAFTGIYEPTLIPEGDLFVAADNKLQPSDGEGKLKGFRAYFQKQGEGARFTKFAIDGGISTGIIGIDGTVVESGNIYTIGGQRVSQPTRGLYIVNGKKVVMQ